MADQYRTIRERTLLAVVDEANHAFGALVNYTAIDVKVVVELTPNAVPPAGPSPEAQRVPSTNWDRVIGTGLIAGAIVLVAGTLVEDFFTAGAGAVDDPASFAAASAGVVRGLQLLRGATVVLPAVAFPAAVQLSVKMSLPNGVLTPPGP